jgi:hypothetical protein
MPPADQKCGKSVPVSTQEEFQNIFSNASKKNKTPDTQTSPTKTVKRSIDNGLQAQMTRTTGYNKVLPKWRQKCYFETFVQGLTVVILLNFSANNPPLRQYPKR